MYKEEKIDENWAEDYRYCRICHKTSSRHVMEGYCKKCFDKLEADVEFTTESRTCLKCGDTFQSEGSGNRRCNKCTKKDATSRYRHRLNITN